MQDSDSGSDSARSSVESHRAVASFHVPPIGVSDAHPARMALFPRICPVSAATSTLSSPSTGECIKNILSASAGAAASLQPDARARTSCPPPHTIKSSSTSWSSYDAHWPSRSRSPTASSPLNTPSPPPSLSSISMLSAAPLASFSNVPTQRSSSHQSSISPRLQRSGPSHGGGDRDERTIRSARKACSPLPTSSAAASQKERRIAQERIGAPELVSPLPRAHVGAMSTLPAAFSQEVASPIAPPIAVKVEQAPSPPLRIDASGKERFVRPGSPSHLAHLRPYPIAISSPSPASGLGSPRPPDSDWDSEAFDELDPRAARRQSSFASAPRHSPTPTPFVSTASASLPARGTKRARTSSESPPKPASWILHATPATPTRLPPSPSSSSRLSSADPSRARVPIHTRRNAAPPDPAGVAVCRWKGCGMRFIRATQPTDLTTDVTPVVPVPVPASGRRRHCVPMDPTQAEILAHLKRVHSVDVNSQTKLQTCCWENCDARLVAKSFARHILGGHLRMMDHVCAVCGKSFSRKDSMTRHIAACVPPGQVTEGRRRSGRGRVMKRKVMVEVKVEDSDEDSADELDELSPLSELSSAESETRRGDRSKIHGSGLVGAIFSGHLSSAETLFKPSVLRAARWSSEESLQTEKDVC